MGKGQSKENSKEEVKMDLSIIYDFDILQLWELYRSEISGNLTESNKKALSIVKVGKSLSFDIGSYIRGEWREESITVRNKKTNKCRIATVIVIEGKSYDKFAFYDEINDRLDIMRNWLKENWANTGLGTIREGGDNEK